VLVAVLIGLALFAFPGRGSFNTWGLIAIVNGALLIIAALDALAAPGRRKLEVQRLHRPTVEKGTTADLKWTITNTSRRRVRIRVADGLAPSLRAVDDRFSATLKPGATATATTTISPVRRGRFVLNGMWIRVDGPLGLASRQYRYRTTTLLRVLPFFRSRRDAEIKIAQARFLEVGLRSARSLGSGTEFENLREYGTDDDFRRIDWRATARAGKPIVRTFRSERNQSVVILLDNGRVMAGQVDGFPRVEHTMDAALMLGTVTTRLGDKCGLMTFDTEVRSVVAPARHHYQLAAFNEAMFDLEPKLAESDYQSAFATAVARFRRRALLVVLTDLVEGAVTEALLPALPIILRTHLVLVGAVSDPVLTQWANEPVNDPDETFRKAAATAALAERERTAARLRALGAVVVDAPAPALPGLLANEYLAVKAAGRL
jgi:uncharacterized protein (DUF58 family)